MGPFEGKGGGVGLVPTVLHDHEGGALLGAPGGGGGALNWRRLELELSLPIPALALTEDCTRLASRTLIPDSPLGQLERTEESDADSLPDEVSVLATQARPRAESQDDLSLESTAKVLPGELSSRKGVLTWSKTLPSIRALVPSLTSKAWPVLLNQ